MNMIGKRFEPQSGQTYNNRGGGSYRCLGGIHKTPYYVGNAYSATMVNTKSGWCFTANALTQYPDGTIEWDYSAGGRFVEA